MVENIVKSTKDQMEKALLALAGELKKVRTGRAQVSMLDVVKVNYYGSATPLNQVAAVSCPDGKSFLIQPWEASTLKEVEASIIKSDLGMSPQNDGKVIRLRLPDLTEARRKELVKTIKKIVEDARVAVRMARRDANESVKKSAKDKIISEDEQKRLEVEIQKLTDGYVDKIDKISEEKEKELMTI